ncbi:hypothetical protein Pint_09173 [Pistacia integerrima]|uniref:Uncharacterized protein n=1 Tax=Pistacia integerrima TaxID=434235 RepID=A0ACC0XWP3_9ROSI|nr:hypothetical protein Pint_09173 [Pistacia integerrima]
MTTRAVEEKERVCVTGAGGYVASWLVKFLLLKGYMVHGTVRDPSDEKNAHLKKLENASENLQLFKTDLLDYEGSVPNPEARFQVDLIEPAVVGTRNVLDACLKAKAKKVVVVSSTAAVGLNPNWPKNQVMDENCWSDKEACKATEGFNSKDYRGSSVSYFTTPTDHHSRVLKTEALEYAEKGELDIVTVCPSIVIGPMLQPTINASSLLLLALLTDGHKTVEGTDRPLVDVRDVAEALLLVYEKPEAKGRYICTSYQIKMQALAHKLKSMFPNYSYSKSFTEDDYEANLSSERLQKLGWKYRPLEEILRDAVVNYEEKGILHKA